MTNWYESNSDEVVALYEFVHAAGVHGWLLDVLPKWAGFVLEVEEGSGRDAAWLASLGHQIVAVEPSDRMRAYAQRLHADADIRWIKDRLPGLENVFRLGLSFISCPKWARMLERRTAMSSRFFSFSLLLLIV